MNKEFTQQNIELGKSTKQERQKTISDLIAALKQCARKRDLLHGKKLHTDAVSAGFHTDKYVGSVLIRMYARCRDMKQGREIFEGMIHRDVVSWNSLIQGYVENGEHNEAMELFKRMSCKPDTVSFLAVLKACLGKKDESERLSSVGSIHRLIKQHGYESDTSVSNTLVDVYIKSGSIPKAIQVFNQMPERSVFTWTSLILGHAEKGEYHKAMDVFLSMDCEPDCFTYAAALKACGGLAGEDGRPAKEFCLEKGAWIHKQAMERGSDSDTVVATALVDMYGKCESMKHARRVFDSMDERDIVTWNSLILGYVRNGEYSHAVELFRSCDCEPRPATYVGVFKAWGGLAAAEKSEFYVEKVIEIHERVKRLGLDSDLILSNTLVDTYCRCGSVTLAKAVFDGMGERDVVTWNSLILGYMEKENLLIAEELLSRMDCQPDSVTYVAAIRCCAAWKGLRKVMEIHKRAREHMLDADIVVTATLVDMYSKVGSIVHARCVFDAAVHRNVITWTSLIMGYVEKGECARALELFYCMDCKPDAFTLLAAVRSCGGLGGEEEEFGKMFCLEKGIGVHKQVKDYGYGLDVVLSNTLIDMYGKCGSMSHASEVFQGMTLRSVVSWNALIGGCVENGDNLVAMDLFIGMDCLPDSFTYVAALKACGALALLSVGQQIHAMACSTGLEQDESFENILLGFYVKCGCMTRAEEVLHTMVSPTIVSWNTLLTGYSSLGNSSKVFRLVKSIAEEGLVMDDITLACLLTACSRAGLVKEAKLCLGLALRSGPGVVTLEHYNCMIDVLGRANRLEEALALVESMPFEANKVTWMTLLGACQTWRNIQISEMAFHALRS